MTVKRDYETMLQYQALSALAGVQDVLKNPAREQFMGWEEETKLKEAEKILDKLVAELKNM